MHQYREQGDVEALRESNRRRGRRRRRDGDASDGDVISLIRRSENATKQRTSVTLQARVQAISNGINGRAVIRNGVMRRKTICSRPHSVLEGALAPHPPAQRPAQHCGSPCRPSLSSLPCTARAFDFTLPVQLDLSSSTYPLPTYPPTHLPTSISTLPLQSIPHPL